MNAINWKKLLLPNIPYLFFVYLFDKVGQAVRLSPGADLSGKVLSLGEGFSMAFANPLPSFAPMDLLIGIAGAVLIRLMVYFKGKNAKKYRKGIEYGSARWGNAEDIKPYTDPVFQNNVLLTQTERLTMNSRPKQPKYARNKNILVIGGSGSGKTRFFVKPNLMQMHSSYVVTDPKGTVLLTVILYRRSSNCLMLAILEPSHLLIRLVFDPALLMHRALKTHLTVGALHLIHGVCTQLPRVDRVGAEVRGDGVAQHIQFHRALEKNAAEPIVVVVQRTLNGCEDGLGEVGGVVLRAEIAHVKAQSLIHKFTAALTVISFQPTIHAADHAGAQPDRGAFLVIIHIFSFLSVSSVKIAAKPCKHGTFPNDRLRLFCKTAKPTAVGDSLKSPALRGFVGRLRALATAAFYLVLLSNG